MLLLKRKRMQNKDNYLTYIPVHNSMYRYESVEGKITIFKENTGVMNRILQFILKKPKVSQIHLDDMGNFVWPLMDGQKDIYAIAQCVHEHFGDAADPLYDRLVKYIKILESYGFVEIKKPEE